MSDRELEQDKSTTEARPRIFLPILSMDEAWCMRHLGRTASDGQVKLDVWEVQGAPAVLPPFLACVPCLS